jgi:high-affinity nickel permease
LAEDYDNFYLKMNTLSTISLLVFGFGLGLKHAIEADHIAAVSTIVGERKSLWSASLVGGLWGLGHTFSLLVAGVVVIFLHVQISERMEQILEFGVALMLIMLGIDTLRKLIYGRQIHLHTHHHGNYIHTHPHLHDESTAHTHQDSNSTHHNLTLSARPLIVGMIHGLAGSGALMLLVLSTISSPAVGLTYISVFGVGSISGMILMSMLVSLPIQLTAKRFAHTELIMRGLAGLFSLCFGLFMVYEIGFVQGLFRI